MRVEIKTDAQKGTDAFKEARRDINKRLKTGLVTAGEKVALPRAKALAPSGTGKLRSSLVVKATTRDAYLTTNLRGKKGRYVGLQEYGGTVKPVIRPKKAKALYINGKFATKVETARVYKPKSFMRNAVDQTKHKIEGVVGDEVLKAFDGFGTS